MTTLIYGSSQDCEIAFYRAFEAADIAAMMAVWAEDDDIVCVHPGGPRLAGIEAVRESWRQIFAGGPGLRIQLSALMVTSTLQTAIHTLHENLSVPGDNRPRVPMIATNVYLRTRSGWRLQLHHASPAPGQPPPSPATSPGREPATSLH
ncbi:MAG: nuclear transport factor 2 family protein [Proteobacteria bacterium]|nr:nuclear transport factor 2 family protein [Burkholderiales bacterium]